MIFQMKKIFSFFSCFVIPLFIFEFDFLIALLSAKVKDGPNNYFGPFQTKMNQHCTTDTVSKVQFAPEN